MGTTKASAEILRLELPPLLTVTDVARLAKVSERTVWRWHSSGEIPRSVVIGGTVRWKGDEIEKWITNRCPSLGT